MYYHNVNAQDWTPPNTNEVVVTSDGNMGENGNFLTGTGLLKNPSCESIIEFPLNF